MDPWFDGDPPSDPSAQSFLATMRDRASRWNELGVRPDDTFSFSDGDLWLTVDVCAPDYDYILRSLRTRLGPIGVQVGDDVTMQDGGVDLSKPHLILERTFGSVTELAAKAADWIERELGRPIELWSWDRAFSHHEARLADSGVCLQSRTIGQRDIDDLGPPDRVRVLRPARRLGLIAPSE
jgi:hypothetical protein